MRGMTYQQVDRQERVDTLLAKGVANLTDVEIEEIRDLYRGRRLDMRILYPAGRGKLCRGDGPDHTRGTAAPLIRGAG